MRAGASIRHRASVLARTDLSGVELLLGNATAVWGAVLMLDRGAYTLAPYVGFHQLHMSAAGLGAILLAVGLGLLAGFLDGRRELRRRMLLSAVALWAFMASVFLMAPIVGNSPYLGALFALHAFLAFLSLRMQEIPIPNG